MTQDQIYLVDDDPLTRELLGQCLEEHGYSVRTFARSLDFEAAFSESPCVLALVDIGLPDIDGFTLLQRLLNDHDCGVVMITARQDLDSRIQALELGADAYLVKPVEPRELIATIGALLRRINRPHSESSDPSSWSFDPRRWRLITPNATEVKLTKTECLLLDQLVRNQGDAVNKARLIQGLGHSPAYFSDARLETLVCRLRRKLQAHAPDWDPIETVRGAGYRVLMD